MSLRVWVRVRVRVRVGLLPASTTGGRAFSAERVVRRVALEGLVGPASPLV